MTISDRGANDAPKNAAAMMTTELGAPLPFATNSGGAKLWTDRIEVMDPDVA